MASNYKRGADFERRVQKVLERYGYVTVRSAGSHSPADVVAMRQYELLLVQCKRDGRLDPDEWNEFLEFCDAAWAFPILAQVGPQGKGVTFNKLTGKKDGGRGRQPMEHWEPRRV